jgi:small subunit ribosomal protein S1
MKQLETDPWDEAGVEIRAQFAASPAASPNITDYGAFVELENGIEGLVHVSEMSWVKKNVHPGKIVSTSQEVRSHGVGSRCREASHLTGSQTVQ